MSQERTIGERLYAVRRTVLQMLHDRGYMVDQNDIDQSEKDFFEKFSTSPQRDALTLLVQRRDDPTEMILVFWPADPKVGVKPIKRYMERMNEEDAKRAILVVQQALTAFARQALTEIQATEGLQIEVFQEPELLVNITEHVLVPQHMVLTKEVRVRPTPHCAAALLSRAERGARPLAVIRAASICSLDDRPWARQARPHRRARPMRPTSPTSPTSPASGRGRRKRPRLMRRRRTSS